MCAQKLKEGPLGINEEYGVETPFLVSSPFWSDNRTSASNAVSEVAILKRFPFESSLKRMTVIALPRGAERYQVFVKGAPEIVASICNQQSSTAFYFVTWTSLAIATFTHLNRSIMCCVYFSKFSSFGL